MTKKKLFFSKFRCFFRGHKESVFWGICKSCIWCGKDLESEKRVILRRLRELVG